MKLKLQIPSKKLIDRTVLKVKAEAVDGAFCLRPHHIDFVAPLVPGLFSYETETGEEILAVDRGVLVKRGDEVLVSVHNAVQGRRVSELENTIQTVFQYLDEREKKSRSALARLEASFVTQYLQAEGAP
jgi:F-type H+-transporting ATPase subunit epsilon